VFDVAISADKSGIIEYWSGAKTDYKFPKCVQFDSKLDTDLFEFVRHKTHPTTLCFSDDGLKFATMSPDRKVKDLIKCIYLIIIILIIYKYYTSNIIDFYYTFFYTLKLTSFSRFFILLVLNLFNVKR